MKIVITNRQSEMRLNSVQIRKFTRAAAKKLFVAPFLLQWELSLAFVNDTEIERVNHQFLQHHGPTDVITFSYPLPPPYSKGVRQTGEIVISTETAQSQARRYRRPPQEELLRYVAHGLLHLAGHEDTTPQQKRKMRREENTLLSNLNL